MKATMLPPPQIEKQFICATCNKTVWSKGRPEGWFTVGQFLRWPEVDRQGMYCSRKCMSRRMQRLSEQERLQRIADEEERHG
jgi:hypothetical protein